MSSFCIHTTEEVERLVNDAYKLRENTPYSFRILAHNLNIFTPYSTRLKELYNIYQLDNILSLPIFPSEVIYITFNYTVECPDENCANFKKSLEKLSISIDSGNELLSEDQNNGIYYIYHEAYNCFFCNNRKKQPDDSQNKQEVLTPKSCIFLDLRLPDEDHESKTGILPMSVILNKEELEDNNV